MSDNYNDDDLDTEVEEFSDESPRGLRRAANKAKKLEAELTSLRRELAFAKAGIPMDDPKMNYFIKGYEGELEPDAIREAAEEAGFLNVEQPAQSATQGSPQEAPEAAAQQRVMRASVGAATEDISEDAAMARMEEAMQEGGIEAMLEVAQQYGIPVSSES
jgi:hypothetical protein